MNKKKFFCTKCKMETYHTVMSIQVPKGRSHEWHQAFYRCDECGLLTRIPIIKYIMVREPDGQIELRISELSGGTAREAFGRARQLFGPITYTDLQNILKHGIRLGLLKETVAYAPVEKATPTGKCPNCGSPTITLYTATNGSKKRAGWYCTACGSAGYG